MNKNELIEFDNEIRPQDDFFGWVNNKWIQKTDMPSDKARYGMFAMLGDQAIEDVHKILKDKVKDAKGNYAEKSCLLYDSYMNERVIEENGFLPIKGEIEEINKLTSKGDLIKVMAKNLRLGVDTFIDFGVFHDLLNPSVNTLYVGQATLGLPDKSYYTEDSFKQVREAYLAYITDVFRLLGEAGVGAGRASAGASGARVNGGAGAGAGDGEQGGVAGDDVATQILEFETEVASHHLDNVERRDVEKCYNPVKREEFFELASSFPMKSFTDELVKEFPNEVIVESLEFIKSLQKFWEKATLETLKNWAILRLVTRYASCLHKEMDELSFSFHGKILSGRVEQSKRYIRAVNFVNNYLGEDVGKIYASTKFSEEEKAELISVIEHIRSAYKNSIESLDWLSEDTRQKALHKLSSIDVKVGYTEKWQDFSTLELTGSLVQNVKKCNEFWFYNSFEKIGKPVDKLKWHMSPQTVNAYYNPMQNEIVIPAAIAQPPFFSINATKAMNYGAIGSVIGHEIGHGFDDQGSKFDANGVMRNWWTEKDRESFEGRTKALIEQYDEFSPKILNDTSKRVNGKLTIGENIGDLGGMQASLDAYKLVIGEQGGAERARGAGDGAGGVSRGDGEVGARAGGAGDGAGGVSRGAGEGGARARGDLQGLSDVQLFFVYFAILWRAKSTKEIQETFLAVDPHSPSEFRVNGVLRNIDEFVDSFGVKEGDEMWLTLDKRVTIW